MSFEPGNVVSLKSGGLHMTVAEVGDDGVQCLWIGDDGDLFRETLPETVLELVPAIGPEDEEENDEDDEEDADEDEDEDGVAAQTQRQVA